MVNGRVRAPELPADLEWFNTAEPLTLAGQRGKVVLLDFWTYCCINCLHVLSDLRYLEEKYPSDLTVVGIHSPKFPHERVSEHVQKAIERHDIRHPVASDPGFRLWRQYGIRAWPSLIFIDPAGQVVGILPGEGRRAQLDQMIQESLLAAERQGVRRPHPLPALIKPERSTGPLRFPGQVLATEERLYVSDTGHHRVLELDTTGGVRRVFGNGRPGLRDGSGESCAFREPQGLAQIHDAVFVADSGNHAIRRIDLSSGHVATRAGTGELGRQRTTELQDPLRCALNSPWALAYRDGVVYVAMAGYHQIWSLDLVNSLLGPFAGSGTEALLDGPRQTAALAQPSGLAMGGDVLYVADSETSAVRAVSLVTDQVTTLVGQGLFEFGDNDGIGKAARLQHPLSVAFDAARRCLWIADSYNDKLRSCALETLEITTLEIGAKLSEPGGLSLVGDDLWVADTNAHRILRVRLREGSAEPLAILP
jgi:thiol-disulfide isomerase/thioredoxin